MSQNLRPKLKSLLSSSFHFLSYLIDRIRPVSASFSDTLVISGFWRSGTTWLQESAAQLLQAKTVFEPFHPLVPATKKLYEAYRISSQSDEYHELFMPYIDTRSERLPLLLSQYSRALRSQSTGKAIRVLRKSVLESFRSRVVVKFTRGHLSLASAQETFLFPLIHLTRDPRAIVASIRMTDWEWLFNHLHVEEQLIQPMAEDTEFFNEWLDIITRYDQNAVHIRIATYWALTELFLEHSLPSNSSLIKVIQYEQLLEEGGSMLVGVLKRLGFDNIKVANSNILNSDSFSTSEERQGATKEDRLAGWKNTLNRNEINDIEALVSDFGLENRFYNGKG